MEDSVGVVVAGSTGWSDELDEASVVVDDDASSALEELEVVASDVGDDVVSVSAVGVTLAVEASLVGAAAPVTGSAANPETMRSGHSAVEVASVYVEAG